LNNLKKVVPIKCGVGSSQSTAQFVHQSSLSHICLEEGDYEVKIISIDDYVDEKNLSVG
jgi:hypothetical protein